MATGFFDMWFDSDYRQRRDINSLHDSSAALESDIAGVSGDVFKLRRQVNDLSLTVAVLLKMLQEKDVVDPKVLHYRVEAEADAMAEAARRPPPVATAAPHKAPVPSFPVKCDRCGETVPSERTTITAKGTLCDHCAERAR